MTSQRPMTLADALTEATARAKLLGKLVNVYEYAPGSWAPPVVSSGGYSTAYVAQECGQRFVASRQLRVTYVGRAVVETEQGRS